MSVRSKTMQPKLWAQKAPEYVSEAKQMGIEIKPPSINHSDLNFKIEGKTIHFGLTGIKSVGVSTVNHMLDARGATPYRDILDFLGRVDLTKVNQGKFVALAYAGVFDCLGYKRKDLVDNAEALYEFIRDSSEYPIKIQACKAREVERDEANIIIERRDMLIKVAKKRSLDEDEQLFVDTHIKARRPVLLKKPTAPVAPILSRHSTLELNLDDILMQAIYIGCYTTHHPVQLLDIKGASDLADMQEGDWGLLRGVINHMQIKTNKRGGKYCILGIDDFSAIAEGFLDERHIKEDLRMGSLVLIEGMIISEATESEPIKIRIKSLEIYKSGED